MKIKLSSESIERAASCLPALAFLFVPCNLGAIPGGIISDELALGTDIASPVSVSWIEYSLILMLVLLNVFIVYAVFVRFNNGMRKAKRALVTILSSMAILLLWAGFRLSQQLATSDYGLWGSVSRSYNWVFLVAVFAVSLGVLVPCCYITRKKPCITISATSKMVQYKGQWISIEEYLSREMGIDVNHGMTKEELDDAILKYHQDVARNGGIPRPIDP